MSYCLGDSMKQSINKLSFHIYGDLAYIYHAQIHHHSYSNVILKCENNVITEEQWEKELDNELQEFELVDDGASNNDDVNQSDDWEKDELDGDDENEEDLK